MAYELHCHDCCLHVPQRGTETCPERIRANGECVNQVCSYHLPMLKDCRANVGFDMPTTGKSVRVIHHVLGRPRVVFAAFGVMADLLDTLIIVMFSVSLVHVTLFVLMETVASQLLSVS